MQKFNRLELEAAKGASAQESIKNTKERQIVYKMKHCLHAERPVEFVCRRALATAGMLDPGYRRLEIEAAISDARTGSPVAARPARGSARIHEALISAILEHRLQPGTKLGEDELGAIFSASRTLVRAALQSMSHEGIVVIEKNRGAFVARPTPDEAREVFEARRLIEPAIAARAAARSSEASERAIRQHLAEEHAALHRGDSRAAIRLSGDFHLLLARLAAHGTYEQMLKALISRSSLIILLYRAKTAPLCGEDHHHDIAKAVAAGDGETASRLMIEHLAEIERGLDLEPKPAKPRRLAEILKP